MVTVPTAKLTSITNKKRVFRASSPLCILDLSRLTRIEKAVKNTTVFVIYEYKVLVYIKNVVANYMFRPLLPLTKVSYLKMA